MRIKVCPVNEEAARKLPEHTGDKSGIGVHYVDAYIKPMNVTLENGTSISCKRKGLKIVLACGERKGEGLMRRVQRGPDPIVMLRAALEEAAGSAGLQCLIEDGAIFLEGV